MLVPDAGLDRVIRICIERGGSTRRQRPALCATAAKTGPRHLAFGTSGQYVYVIGEGASTMTVLALRQRPGYARPRANDFDVAAGFEARSACADVHVHPSGWYVYGSNRGDDSIVTFQVEAETGTPVAERTYRHRWSGTTRFCAGSIGDGAISGESEQRYRRGLRHRPANGTPSRPSWWRRSQRQCVCAWWSAEAVASN